MWHAAIRSSVCIHGVQSRQAEVAVKEALDRLWAITVEVAVALSINLSSRSHELKCCSTWRVIRDGTSARLPSLDHIDAGSGLQSAGLAAA